MGQKFITIDGNNVVLEPYDEDNNNVPAEALPITEDEFRRLSIGFDMFQYVGGKLISNDSTKLIRDKNILIDIAREDIVETLISPERARINSMSRVDVDAELISKGRQL